MRTASSTPTSSTGWTPRTEPSLTLCDDRRVYSPDVPPTARRIAFWLAVVVAVIAAARLVLLLLMQTGVLASDAGTSSAIAVLLVLLTALLLGEAVLAALACRAGDFRRARIAFVVVAVVGLLSIIPTPAALLALWLLRRRSVVED
jgi:hypothetical protein